MVTRWSSHHPACFKRSRSPHVSSSANDSFKTFTGACSCRPHHSHYSHGRQNRRSSFCSGRGDNLVTIARLGKPLFANMHHRVYAVDGALRKPNVACPHPDIPWMASDVIDAEFALRRCQCVDLSSTERIFFAFALFAKNASIDLKCIENHGVKLHSQQQAATVELLPGLSKNLLRCCEKGLSASGVGFSNFETNYLDFSSTSTAKRLRR